MHQVFHWINEPATWSEEDGVLRVVTDAQTDFWRETWYGFERFSGHIYATEAAADFTFQVRVRADFSTLYDQAGSCLCRTRNAGSRPVLSTMTARPLSAAY